MRPGAVVVTDRPLFPPWTGNRVRILGLLRALRALGWMGALVSPETESSEALRLEVDRLDLVRAATFQRGDVGAFDFRPFRAVTRRVVASVRPAVVVAEYAWMVPA